MMLFWIWKAVYVWYVSKELKAWKNTHQNVIYHFLNQLSVFHESSTKCNLFWIIYGCLSKRYQKVYYNNLSLTAETSLIFICLFFIISLSSSRWILQNEKAQKHTGKKS